MVSVEYLAGFTDGEGYLALGRIPRENKSYEYPVRMVVYNTNGELLEEIKQTWGGTLSYSPRREEGWRPQYALIWTNEAAARLIAKIAPYLRIKSRQAAALMRFHDHVRGSPRRRDSKGHLLPLTPEEREYRAAYHAYVKRLNARGPVSETPSPSEPGFADVPPSLEPRVPISPEYLAGFVDAEGSIMIARYQGAGQWLYRSRMTLTNTDRAVLAGIQEAYGGNLVDNRRPHPGWKQGFQIVWTGRMIDRVLPLIASRVRLKRKQAFLLMEFVDHMKKTGRSRLGSPEVRSYRERLWMRMRELNARGPSPRGELEPVSGDALLGVQPAEDLPDAQPDLHAGGLDVREHRGNPEPVV